MGMPDMWTALQFDRAVTMFGQWVEGKLMERDDDHNPKHTLRELLDLPFSPQEAREQTRMSLMWLKTLASNPRSGVRLVN